MDYLHNILIVDDDEIQRIFCINTLSNFYCIDNIYVANNGEEALEIFNNNNIDIIITDIKMPKMDGISLIKEIRKKSEVPIIVMSWITFDYINILNLNIQEFLPKEITPFRLVQTVNKYI